MFIKDPALLEIISKELHIPAEKLKKEDMEKLTELHAPYAEISQIHGLEYAKNLVYLDLQGNNIEVLD
ncbi:MAG: Rab family protein, partial [Erysipelotrichaceae bacterium]|nr:Rab family protein [Erysipelotrichaceae bacterium]